MNTRPSLKLVNKDKTIRLTNQNFQNFKLNELLQKTFSVIDSGFKNLNQNQSYSDEISDTSVYKLIGTGTVKEILTTNNLQKENVALSVTQICSFYKLFKSWLSLTDSNLFIFFIVNNDKKEYYIGQILIHNDLGKLYYEDFNSSESVESDGSVRFILKK